MQHWGKGHAGKGHAIQSKINLPPTLLVLACLPPILSTGLPSGRKAGCQARLLLQCPNCNALKIGLEYALPLKIRDWRLKGLSGNDKR